MAKISRQEILNIAHVSHLEIHESEIDALIEPVEQVLTYAERVKEMAGDIQEQFNKNINIMRDDSIGISTAETILSRAPEREGDYFVVPIILKGNG